MEMNARQAFESGTAAFNAHDIDRFAAVLADDVIFEVPGGIRGAGKAACVEYYGGWFGAFPDAHVEVHALHLVDDVAVEEGTFSGTHDGVLHDRAGDVPPTGRSVTLDYVQVLRFRDGRHASFRLMFDRLQMLEQLGLSPAACPPGDIWLEWPRCATTSPVPHPRHGEVDEEGSARQPEDPTAVDVGAMARMRTPGPESTNPPAAPDARQAAAQLGDGGEAAHLAGPTLLPVPGGRL